jgi:stearoyl-CoA desaturase (delta-9 desaturase)
MTERTTLIIRQSCSPMLGKFHQRCVPSIAIVSVRLHWIDHLLRPRLSAAVDSLGCVGAIMSKGFVSPDGDPVGAAALVEPPIDEVAELGPPIPHIRSPGERKLILINLAAVLVPPVGLIAALALAWGSYFNGWYLLLLVGMSMLTATGVTVGYHRLCTHRSFETPPALRYFFAAIGSMAVQGPVIRWCAEHRRHHQHSDKLGDPHSPHMSPDGSWGEGIWATLRGAYHAHVGWLFSTRSKALGKYSMDLRADPVLVRVDAQFVYWVLVGLFLPGVITGLLTMSWMGALLGFLWGGLVRVFVVHHVTWSVNSICHLWGTRPFVSHDESRNNPIVAFLAMGEGWHNNHHAFPASARHGLRWWEFDASYILIRSLSFVGLTWDIKLPSRERMKRQRSGAKHGGTPE